MREVGEESSCTVAMFGLGGGKMRGNFFAGWERRKVRRGGPLRARANDAMGSTGVGYGGMLDRKDLTFGKATERRDEESWIGF